MTRILVTVEESSMIQDVIEAIKKLRGVSDTQLLSSDSSATELENRVFSPKVSSLFGIAKNIEFSQIVNDDRLAYLLSK